jgi:hypothetical protein
MQQSSTIAIFCCYARKDKALLDELTMRLSPLQRRKVIQMWGDGDLTPGTEWGPEIKKRLNEAHIILLLISPDFLNSDYCYSTQMQQAIARHSRGDARVIPVLLRPTNGWEQVPPGDIQLGNLQALPTGAKAVTTWENRDLAWQDVVQGIEQGVNEWLLIGSLPSGKPRFRVLRRSVVIGLTGTALVAGSISALFWTHVFSFPSSVQGPPASPTQDVGNTVYTYRGHLTKGTRALAWSPDSKRIATASDDHTAQVWDALTGQNRVICQHNDYVEGVAWSPDNTRIVSGCADGTVQIWNARTGDHLSTYRGHIDTYPGSAYQSHAWVNRVSWSFDGRYIVSCDQTSDPSRTATSQVWDAENVKTIVTYRGHKNGILAVAWSSDNKRIASAGYDGTLQIWDATNGTVLATYRGNAYLFGLSWSPDSKYVAVGSSNNTVLIVSASDGTLQTLYSGHSDWVNDASWSPSGEYVASGGRDGLVMLWDTVKGTNIYTYSGHVGPISGVAWSPKGELIASAGDVVQVWRAL